jgi:hypothetical protein
VSCAYKITMTHYFYLGPFYVRIKKINIWISVFKLPPFRNSDYILVDANNTRASNQDNTTAFVDPLYTADNVDEIDTIVSSFASRFVFGTFSMII